MRVCATGDGAVCSKNRKIVPYHGDNPILEMARALSVSVPDYGSWQEVIQLKSPTLLKLGLKIGFGE